MTSKEMDQVILDSPILKEAVNILTRNIFGKKEIQAIEVAIDYWEYVSLMLKERLEQIRNEAKAE